MILISLFFGLISLIGTVFWFWMLYDCIRYEEDRVTWLLILFFLNVPGAILYLVIRKISRTSARSPGMIKRLTKRREIQAAESAAHHIGKAHQFVQLGDLLYETGQYEKAGDAYRKALDREPDLLKAMWGAARVALKGKQYQQAREYLHELLQKDPKYAYGDASLSYGRTLLALDRLKEGKDHLEKHLKGWSHPEARCYYAELLAEDGQIEEAKKHLQTVISDVKNAPSFNSRRNGYWASRAKKRLKQIGG